MFWVVFLLFVSFIVWVAAAIATDALDDWGDDGYNKDGSRNRDDDFARATGLWWGGGLVCSGGASVGCLFVDDGRGLGFSRGSALSGLGSRAGVDDGAHVIVEEGDGGGGRYDGKFGRFFLLCELKGSERSVSLQNIYRHKILDH